MATYNDGIFGGFSGKVGTVIGTTWRGKNVLRSAPTKSTKPPSPAQLLQREKFALVKQFLDPLQWLLNQTFGLDYGDKTPYNRATSYVLKNAIRTTDEGLELNYSKILISKGFLQGIQDPEIISITPNSLALRWVDDSEQGLASPDDVLLVVGYVPASESFIYFKSEALRADMQAELEVPSEFIGQEMVLWATFLGASEQMVATSKYLGSVTT